MNNLNRFTKAMWGTVALALGLAACSSSGGGGDPGARGPALTWQRVLRSNTNIALGSSALEDNEGIVSRLPPPATAEITGTPPPTATPGEISHTSLGPTVGRNGFLYIGTEGGLLSLDENGETRWTLDTCTLIDGQNNSQDIALGRISTSPTIGADGRELVLGTDTHIFLLREPETGNDLPECIFAFNSGSQASAIAKIENSTLRVLWLVSGTDTGFLTAINADGSRRWSFPDLPFDRPITGHPAEVAGGFVFVGPDGEMYNVDQAGRLRWSVRIGPAYDSTKAVTSPPPVVVFNNFFALDADGDIVAISSAGRRLWTYSAEAPFLTTPAASPLTTTGNIALGENVVFAVDSSGMMHGIGEINGELIRFCDSKNEACVPSNCPDEAECLEVMRCSDTNQRVCTEDDECPDGESCIDTFRCANDETMACRRDSCITNDDEDSRCVRPALHPLDANMALDVRTHIAVSSDSFIVAATSDGNVCSRRLDGTVPAGSCSNSNAECVPDSCATNDRCCTAEDGDVCTLGFCIDDPSRACTPDNCPEINCQPDSCGDGDRCCTDDDDNCDIGLCIGNPMEECTPSNCPDTGTEQFCESPWQTGCIAVEDPTAAAPAVLIDGDNSIIVTGEKGLFRIQ